MHHLNRSQPACECSIGTRQYYASDMGARRGGHGAIQSIISQTNNGCSLRSLILAKLLLLDINSKNVFALSIVTASRTAERGGQKGSLSGGPGTQGDPGF